MIKLGKGTQLKQQYEHLESYAYFVSNFSISFNYVSSHSDSWYAMQYNYAGSCIVDPSASDHMTSDLTQLYNLKPLCQPIKIILLDGP